MRHKLRQLLWTSVTMMVIVLMVAYGTASWYVVSQMTIVERKPLETTPVALGLAFEEVEFPSRRGDVVLKGWYIPANMPQATIIISHNIFGNRADTHIGLLEIARDLGQRGFSVLLFDLRGHGESGGSRVSGGYFEKQDALGAFDFLVEQGESPGKIGLLGFSMGGAAMLLAAGEESAIQAVVADSAFADIADILVGEVQRQTGAPDWLAAVLMPGIKVVARLFYGIPVSAIKPIEAIAGLDYPVLLIHGAKNTIVSSSHSERMKQASPNEETELWLVEEAEHVQAYRVAPQEYIQRVATYFEEQLK